MDNQSLLASMDCKYFDKNSATPSVINPANTFGMHVDKATGGAIKKIILNQQSAD